MKEFEREELKIRMDQRDKTIFNQMEHFDKLDTNHLSHHEQWEDDIKNTMRWWIGLIAMMATGSGAMLMGVI